MLMNSGPSGPLAYMFLADERGYLAAGNLAMDFVAGDGAAAIVPRVIKEGFDFGYGDFGALIHLAATDPSLAPVAVYMAFNQTPLTIAVAADGPVRTWRDLEGRTVLGHPTDAALVMFPALANAAGINASRVTIEKSPASMRALNERMLKGEVAGVFGFVNTIVAALAPAGVMRSALRFLEYRDHLPDLCGNVLMVRKSLLREHPADVRAVVRAFNRGLRDTVANIDDAINALAKREPTVRRDVDKARLAGTLHVEMNHHDLAQLGAGDVTDARVARSISAITSSATYAHRPTVREVFVRSVLPPSTERVRMMSPKVRMLLNSGFTGANAWIALARRYTHRHRRAAYVR